MSTVTSPVRLSDKVKPWITKALRTHGEGESIKWELGVTVLPDPSVTGESDSTSTDLSEQYGLLPMLVIFLELATDDPNISVYSSPVVRPFGVSQELVDSVIKIALDDLRATRAKPRETEDSESLLDLPRM